MCGIAGYRGDGTPELLDEMLDCLTYRGPDEAGTFIDEGIGLGNRRLSIIGRSSGKQPITNEDETVHVVYNGEIYNFQGLREELEAEGHDFATETDTEVLVHGYEEWGEAVLQRLNGMFAFALWDADNEKLLLARDRLGIKPLYYTVHDNTLSFGSEIKALLQSDVPRQINMDAVRQYFTYRCVIDDQTPLSGVYKVLPGHYLVYDGDEVRLERYWNTTYSPQYTDPGAAAQDIRSLLEDAVEKRLIAEVPIAAFLSGGLDSSAIVALMSELVDEPLKTFSAGFPGNEEHEYAELVADHVGADHTSFTTTADDLMDVVPAVVHHLDEPMADPAVFPSYLLGEKVKDKATVFLLGEGSDELFGGYSEYYPGSSYARMVPDALKRYAFKRFRIPEEPSFLTASYGNRTAELDAALREEGDFLSRVTRFDLTRSIPNFQCVKVDRMSMAHSLEARVPFLDHRIVELSQQIPSRYKMKGVNEKWILKKAVKDVLPEKIVGRKKQVFFTPVQDWMETAVTGSGFDVLRKSRLAANGIIDQARTDRILETDKHYLQYMLYMLEHWYRGFVDGESL